MYGSLRIQAQFKRFMLYLFFCSFPFLSERLDMYIDKLEDFALSVVGSKCEIPPWY